MDVNLTSGNMIPGASYGTIDLLQGSSMHHHQNPNPSFHHHPPHPSFCQHQASTPPAQMNHMKMDCDQQMTYPVTDYDNRGKNFTSDDDEVSLNTDNGGFFQSEFGKGKKVCSWQRVKWSDLMVRLLITAVSYLGQDDAVSDFNIIGRRKAAMMQKKGKWRLISKVLGERGFYVSPQQCEDKFNDLNKRYKRLTDILGRGTSCKIVENPALLDLMDHVSDKLKDEVRKILSSKQLFYEEMCSYHNQNRLNLPANPALQRSLQLALRSSVDDDHDAKNIALLDDNDDYDDDEDSEEGGEEENDVFTYGPCFHKRMKHEMMDHEEKSFLNSVCSQEFNKRSSGLTVPTTETSHAFSDCSKAAWMQMEMMRSRSLQLDEQSLHIQSQMLKLEKQRFKWLRFSKKKGMELDNMRMENERIKLENEQLTLDLKRKQSELGRN